MSSIFTEVFQQVGFVLVQFLPIRTIQNIVESQLVDKSSDVLSDVLRKQLYIDLDQMRERLDQFKQSLLSYPEIAFDDGTSYQIWNITLYDSFSDEELSEIETRDILSVVPMQEILAFCLLPEAEFFTTVQSKHDGMVQNVNIWSKPKQIHHYLEEILQVSASRAESRARAHKTCRSPSVALYYSPLFQLDHASRPPWRTVCHGIWSADTLDGIMRHAPLHKSLYEKCKYYDWLGMMPSHDIEFCNIYPDDSDAMKGNYYPALRDVLCVADFVQHRNIIKEWYAVDIETTGIDARLTVLNSNLLFGFLEQSQNVIIKKQDGSDAHNTKHVLRQTEEKNEQRQEHSRKMKSCGALKPHVATYRFKFIVFKRRYKLKDEINAELDELARMECMD